jgi:hypothetical protein
MITNSIGYQNAVKFELSGLSTDTKPTGTFAGKTIANGSSFFEMDTQNVKFYDAENDVWV